MKKQYIYYLKCPIDKQVKYVGKCGNPKTRYKQHISKLDKQHTPKRKWLEMLLHDNKRPILEIVCEVDNEQEARLLEQEYLNLHKETALNIHNPEKGAKSRKWKLNSD